MFGIWDKQENKFKECWKDFESKSELKIIYEEHMKDVLIDGSEINEYDFEEDNELWDLFDYEIREFK
ncbi:hypothetical protein [Mammaliicoccus vitulinus]|uniref:hypothetical protein n=1 Tax=Mammaliicoccus vitulinus TaxID=71237 RepID=UPI00248AA402|nr:hypothetical protein [Mammaliicoccus vitulinus]